MDNPSNRLIKSPNYKKLAEAMGVIAGFASALSVAVGLLAARMAPHGPAPPYTRAAFVEATNDDEAGSPDCGHCGCGRHCGRGAEVLHLVRRAAA